MSSEASPCTVRPTRPKVNRNQSSGNKCLSCSSLDGNKGAVLQPVGRLNTSDCGQLKFSWGRGPGVSPKTSGLWPLSTAGIPMPRPRGCSGCRADRAMFSKRLSISTEPGREAPVCSDVCPACTSAVTNATVRLAGWGPNKSSSSDQSPKEVKLELSCLNLREDMLDSTTTASGGCLQVVWAIWEDWDFLPPTPGPSSLLHRNPLCFCTPYRRSNHTSTLRKSSCSFLKLSCESMMPERTLRASE